MLTGALVHPKGKKGAAVAMRPQSRLGSTGEDARRESLMSVACRRLDWTGVQLGTHLEAPRGHLRLVNGI
ncbi:hypothetical protein NDU88_001558 [Pleurodeles waltl]|uniref:Uncharacterized protein n=1 Tax=Pleurodeles waltl TaxID=8319 RepID=A0AAV7UUP1_PLEWA|nr:hypothetical protein NDU88_001558 [Pleurodeles waltl]